MPPRDYTKLKYYMNYDGVIYCGPFPAVGNFHYKAIPDEVFRNSDPPEHSVEITPLQAAEYLYDTSEILKQDDDYDMPF